MARAAPWPLKCLLCRSRKAGAGVQSVPPFLPPSRPQALSVLFLPPLLSSFLFFFPTSGSPNPKLKVNRCCWLPSSIPGGASQDLECQKAAAGRDGRSLRVGNGAWEEEEKREDGTKHNFIGNCPFPNQRLFLIYAVVFHLACGSAP